jgi:hypothetical protein
MPSITFFSIIFGSHLLVFRLSPSDVLLVFRCELDAIGVIAMDNFRGEVHNVLSPWGLGLQYSGQGIISSKTLNTNELNIILSVT